MNDIIRFVVAVITLRSLYPLSVTSWFRTEDHNKKVGGVVNSFHRFGLAVDAIMDDGFVYNIDQFITDAKRLGLEVIDEGDHWHIEVI